MGWSNSKKKDFTLGVSVDTGMNGLSSLRKDRGACPEPFKTMAVNFNGLVSICCVDWSFGTIIGDVSKESLRDIWKGRKMHEFRIRHLKGRRKEMPACRDCQFLEGMGACSDIDGAAGELIAKYERAK